MVRSFVQLAAIGYVINFIFGLKSIGLVVLLLAGMVLFAAWTSARRAENVPRAFMAAVAVGVAAGDVGLLLTLRSYPDGAVPDPPRRHGNRKRHERRQPDDDPYPRRRGRTKAQGRGGPSPSGPRAARP